MLTGLILIALGLVLAFAGGRLAWLVISTAGFLLGYNLALLLAPDMDLLLSMAIGILTGLLFGFLAVRFLKFTLSLIGFFLFGGVAVYLANFLALEGTWSSLIAFCTGGILGIFLVNLTFDLALILISVIAGAALVAQGMETLFEFDAYIIQLGRVVIGLLGFLFQWQRRRR